MPTRRRDNARHLFLLPTVEVVEADVAAPAVLPRLAQGADAIVNLVGILNEGGAETFDRAHVEVTQRCLDAGKAAGVRRFIQMSALNADAEGPSGYQRSKGRAEAAVVASGLAWTIFQPSVIFGREDAFLNLFARLLRFLPVMALAGANVRFQPVFVGDVAKAFANALDEPATHGRCYELAGPEVFTLRELVRIAGELAGVRRPVIGLNDVLGRAQALALELAPGPTLMSRDNFDSMAIDNVASGPVAPELDIRPTSIAAVAPRWSADRNTRASEARTRARR